MYEKEKAILGDSCK